MVQSFMFSANRFISLISNEDIISCQSHTWIANHTLADRVMRKCVKKHHHISRPRAFYAWSQPSPHNEPRMTNHSQFDSNISSCVVWFGLCVYCCVLHDSKCLGICWQVRFFKLELLQYTSQNVFQWTA